MSTIPCRQCRCCVLPTANAPGRILRGEDTVMNTKTYFRNCFLSCNLVVALQVAQGFAQQNLDATKTKSQETATQRDGQHDFDFDIGTWKTHLSRLPHPLTGSTTWIEYEGTT